MKEEKTDNRLSLPRIISYAKIILMIILLVSLYEILWYYQENGIDRRPVDDCSKAIKDAVGNDFDFRERKIFDNGNVVYHFETNKYDAGAIGRFQDACQDVCSSDQKMAFSVSFHIPGGFATMFYIQNYNDEGEIYEGMYYLRIFDQTNRDDAACNPRLYSEIEGIRELHVAEAIQEKADEMGIDWYEYWPDLETIVIEDY